MNGSISDSPSVLRRQRGEDYNGRKILQPGTLPTLNAPVYQENSRKGSEQSSAYKKLDDMHPSRSSAPTTSEGFVENLVFSNWNVLRSRFPILRKAQELALRVPPRLRFLFILLWFTWKIVLLCAFLIIMSRNNHNSSSTISQAQNKFTEQSLLDANSTKVLYIVTSSLDDNGARDDISTKGQDLLFDQHLAVMIDGVESMVGTSSVNLEVDVFLVCGFPLTSEREERIRKHLPNNVGFQFWDNATPLAYEREESTGSMIEYKRALARQHRFVIRDKLDYYDLFLAFKDDVLVRGEHVHHYLQLSAELERLLALSQKEEKMKDDSEVNHEVAKFNTDLTKQEIEHFVPGFIQVEACCSGEEKRILLDSSSIPADHDFNNLDGGGRRAVNIDPTICCHPKQYESINTKGFERPHPDDLIAWDTNIKLFSLQQFPPESDLLDWVVLMPGPKRGPTTDKTIGSFLSSKKGAFNGKEKSDTGKDFARTQMFYQMISFVILY